MLVDLRGLKEGERGDCASEIVNNNIAMDTTAIEKYEIFVQRSNLMRENHIGAFGYADQILPRRPQRILT